MANADNPKRWGCRWHENLRKRHHRSKSMWFQNAMPWVVPDQYNFATTDFTPNYLCTEKALKNIYSSARDPKVDTPLSAQCPLTTHHSPLTTHHSPLTTNH